MLRAREFWVEAVGVSRQGCTVRRHLLQPREGLRVLKHKRKSRSVVATERLWGDLLRQRFYGEYFIKLDRRFATRRIDDGREFDVAGDWDLRRVRILICVNGVLKHVNTPDSYLRERCANIGDSVRSLA